MRANTFGRLAMIATMGLLCGVPSPAPVTHAQVSSSTASANNVGVVKLNDVLNALDEKSSREAELKRIFAEKEAQVNAVLDRVKALEAEIKLLPKDSPTRNAKREEYARLRAQARIEAQIAQATAEEKKKQMEIELFEKIKDATAEVAPRRGLLIVISDDSQVEIPETAEYRDVQLAMITRRLLYVAPSVDISGEVANYMNNQFKASGGKKPQ